MQEVRAGILAMCTDHMTYEAMAETPIPQGSEVRFHIKIAHALVPAIKAPDVGGI